MFRIFKQMAWFIRSYKTKYILAILLLIISNAFVLLPPLIIGRVTDGVNQGTLDTSGLFLMIGLLLGSVVLGYIVGYGWGYLLFAGSVELELDLRRMLMKKFLGQSPIFYEKNSTGSLMAKSTSDVSSMSIFAGFGIMSLIDSTLFPLAVITIMAVTVNLSMTILSVLPLGLMVLTSRYLDTKIETTYKESQEAFDHLNEKVLENVSGVRVVRSYVTEDREVREFQSLAGESYQKSLNFQKFIALFYTTARIIPGISFIIAMVSGAYFIGQHQVTLGELVSFTIYLEMLNWPVFAYSEFVTVSKQASTSMDRIQEVLDYPEDFDLNPQGLKSNGRGDLEFKSFHFRYPSSDEQTLKDVSFSLRSGETLGVVGKIGSGKTTLVKQLLHLYPIANEMLYIADHPIEDYDIKSLRRHIGYVPQRHFLFSKSVRENVVFGHPDQDISLLDESLQRADFIKDLVQLPKGLDTLTGEGGVALSGGQKQRLSIARALIKDPEILILDDSLSAVDATTETNILESIKEHRQGKTNLITAHRLSAVAHADLILVLDQGRIIQRGTHEELISTEGWYREQFEHQKLERGDHE